MAKAKIALLGTGLMGAPMTLNLLKAGHQVQVWNRSLEKAEPLAAHGAMVCRFGQHDGSWHIGR